MKNTERQFKPTLFVAKFFIANCIATIVSSLVLWLYVGSYDHFFPTNGVASVCHSPNARYFQFTEGGFIGKFDYNGFNNKQQTTNGVSVLLLGSSQFEALQVFPNKNLGALLNEWLEKSNSSGTVYCLGVSGNFFPFLVAHYERALQEYTPRQYAVVEFAPDHIDPAEVKKALDGSLLQEDLRSKPSFAKRLVVRLRLIDSLRIALKKRRISPNKQMTLEKSASKDDALDVDELLPNIQKCFQILAENSKEHNVQCLILFRPRVEINADGSLASTSSEEYVQQLKTLSEAEGLVFVDMTARIISEYGEKKILPYGFWNTLPNAGHCNKEGHRMMAEAIYDKIMELENAKEKETK